MESPFVVLPTEHDDEDMLVDAIGMEEVKEHFPPILKTKHHIS